MVDASIPITATVRSTPDSRCRVLFSQYHNLLFPPGYLPRDRLEVKNHLFYFEKAQKVICLCARVSLFNDE